MKSDTYLDYNHWVEYCMHYIMKKVRKEMILGLVKRNLEAALCVW